ncbi:MAG: NAD(P)-binding protein [Gammaproteobacteria bacterium]
MSGEVGWLFSSASAASPAIPTLYSIALCYFRNRIMTKIAIIGAGLSGLSLARMLQVHAEVTLFEKSRGLSGRMATRRAESYCFDHGAQYFTARTPAFQHFIQPLIEAGVVERWHARYVKFDGEQVVERKNWMDDEPRYVFVPGMNRIGQHCSQGLNIQLNTRINALARSTPGN